MKILWENNFPDIFPLTSIAKLKNHPLYKEAKTGNIEAAFHVIAETVNYQRIEEIKIKFSSCCILPVLSANYTGHINMLPLAIGTLISIVNKLEITTEIIQTNSLPHHTSSSAMIRILEKPVFEGKVNTDTPYLLVDDVSTSGCTLAALRRFIICNGGKVCGATVGGISSFHSIGYGGYLALKKDTLEKLENKFDPVELNNLLNDFKICNDYRELTNSQAKYILAYKNLEQFRKRCIAYRIQQSVATIDKIVEKIPEEPTNQRLRIRT